MFPTWEAWGPQSWFCQTLLVTGGLGSTRPEQQGCWLQPDPGPLPSAHAVPVASAGLRAASRLREQTGVGETGSRSAAAEPPKGGVTLLLTSPGGLNATGDPRGLWWSPQKH